MILITRARAEAIMREAQGVSIGLPWECKLDSVMEPGERESIHRVWIDQMPGSSSFADTLMAIANGHVKPKGDISDAA